MKRLMIIFVALFIFSITAHAQMGMMGCQQGQMGQGMMGGGQQPMMDCSMMQKMSGQGMMQGGQQGQMGQGMMGGGQQPMMNCPMMQPMSGQGMMQGGQQMPMMQTMGQGMMAPDMMQMMMDMMNMQERMITGVKGAEKKKMLEDLNGMKEKMKGMMSMRSTMMGGMMRQPGDVSQCRLSCAEHWLKKAIDLHEVHIKDPKTATEASQMEMMDQMKKAYECLTTARCGMAGAPLNESESKETEEEKTRKRDEHGH